ncbi:hypothetical protein [Microbacterium neimengense]
MRVSVVHVPERRGVNVRDTGGVGSVRVSLVQGSDAIRVND